MSTIRPDIIRTNTVVSYITRDLGYCCAWGFFQLYPGPKWTQLVADRLGVSTRAIRYCRNAAKSCDGNNRCKQVKILAATNLNERKE